MNTVKRLFGVNAEDIKENVIITPFLNVEYFARSASSEKAKGFLFETLTQDQFSVVKTGVGASFVGDAIMYLRQTPCTRLYFIGSCASLPPYDVGDIIVTGKALAGESFSDVLQKNTNACSFVVAENNLSDDFFEFYHTTKEGKYHTQQVQVASIATLGSLSLQSALFDSLEQQGIGGVDMEVSAFFSAANKVEAPCLAVLYVTDTIAKKLFFRNLTTEERKTIKVSRQQAITFVCDFITQHSA